MKNHSDPFSTSTINAELDNVTGACNAPCCQNAVAGKAPPPAAADRCGWPLARQQQNQPLQAQQQQGQRFNFQQWWPQFQQFFRSFRNNY